jgi:hypothetical protein
VVASRTSSPIANSRMGRPRVGMVPTSSLGSQLSPDWRLQSISTRADLENSTRTGRHCRRRTFFAEERHGRVKPLDHGIESIIV